MVKYFIHIIIIFVLLSCSNEVKERKAEVFEIRQIGELSTTEYTVGKIIKLDDKAEEWYKYGDRKILINCKAKIKVGIDLSQLQKEDIKISGNSIEITMPPAQITSFSMDPSLIRTEMESVTGLRDNFTQKEKNSFLKQGEDAIKNDISETGIIDEANENAEVFLFDFYTQLGFEKVIVKRTIQKDEE